VTEASQITFHMVTESNLEQHKQILAKARFEAATLRSDIANYLHAHKEVMTQVNFCVCKVCIVLCPTLQACRPQCVASPFSRRRPSAYAVFVHYYNRCILGTS